MQAAPAMCGLSVVLLFVVSIIVISDLNPNVEAEDCADAVEVTSLLQVHTSIKGGRSVGTEAKDAFVNASVNASKAVGLETFAVNGSKMRMPARGFITCCNGKISKPVMLQSLKAYLKAGGRLIDSAPDYDHEDTVGEAVRTSGIPRKEIWLSSKVDTDGWTADMGDPKAWVLKQVENSLRKMNVSYMDSMTLHFGVLQVAMQATKPVVGAARHMGPAESTKMWQGLIAAKKAGKVLNIGVCETTRSEIENLIAQTGETPSMIVTWYNPWTPAGQKDYIKWAQSKGIAVTAYGVFNFKSMGVPKSSTGFAGDAAVKAAGKAGKHHGVTWGQIVMQWLLDQKVGFVTPMYHEGFVAEDTQRQNFSLSQDDHRLLASVPAMPCDDYLTVQVMPGCYP